MSTFGAVVNAGGSSLLIGSTKAIRASSASLKALGVIASVPRVQRTRDTTRCVDIILLSRTAHRCNTRTQYYNTRGIDGMAFFFKLWDLK